MLVAVSALPVSLGRVPPPDRLVRRWVTTHQDGGAFAALDTVIRFAAWQWVCLALILLSGVVALARGSVRPLRQAVLAVLVQAVVVWSLKAVLERPGPTGVIPPPHEGAWPSGHAVTLVVVTVVVLRWFPSLPRGVAVAAFLPSAALAAALVYCDDHWFTDVAVAFPLGALLAWVGLRAESLLGDPGGLATAGADPDAPPGAPAHPDQT
jgi:membrane-associated phospholipid phosphatase